MKVGVLALQGDVREHVRARSLSSARTPVEVRVAGGPERRRRAHPAGRRVDDDVDAARVDAACSTRSPARLARRHAGVRDVRGDDPAWRPRCSTVGPTSGLRRHRPDGAPQRLRPPGRLVRDRPRRRRAGRGRPAVFIRAPFVERVGRRRRGAGAAVDGHPVLCRSGHVLVSSFHPELSG